MNGSQCVNPLRTNAGKHPPYLKESKSVHKGLIFNRENNFIITKSKKPTFLVFRAQTQPLVEDAGVGQEEGPAAGPAFRVAHQLAPRVVSPGRVVEVLRPIQEDAVAIAHTGHIWT